MLGHESVGKKNMENWGSPPWSTVMWILVFTYYKFSEADFEHVLKEVVWLLYLCVVGQWIPEARHWEDRVDRDILVPRKEFGR